MTFFIVLGVLVLFVVRWVGKRKARLAGLDATRPTYSVQPPSGRVGRRSREAL